MLKNSVLDGREDLAGVRQVSVLQVVGGGGGGLRDGYEAGLHAFWTGGSEHMQC